MPTTLHLLKEHSPVLLGIIKEVRSANVDLLQDDAETLALLADELTSPGSVQNAREELSADPAVAKALDALVAANGSLPETQFFREFGALEIMGDLRLQAEERWMDPQSVSEVLYFNGLIGRGFAGLGPDAQRIIYMPSDVVDQFPPPERARREGAFAIRDVPPPSRDETVDDRDFLLNDVGSVLGCLYERAWRLDGSALHAEDDARLNRRLLALPDTAALQTRKRLLLHIAKRLGLFKPEESEAGGLQLALNRNRANRFLRLDRNQQRTALWDAWIRSPDWNDLAETPTLDCRNTEKWKNNPKVTREVFLGHCRNLAMGRWYRVQDVAAAIHEHAPDFQRPGANYDDWYVWNIPANRFGHGFEDWDLVDGELVRFLLEGPMQWLGALQRGAPLRHRERTMVTLTRAGAIWLGASLTPEAVDHRPRVRIRKGFAVHVPLNMPLRARFRIERIAHWQRSGTEYVYQINQRSLDRAFREGLKGDQILESLRGLSDGVPASVERGIRKVEGQWATQGGAAREP